MSDPNGKVEAYWREYLDTLPPDSPVRGESYEVDGFGDSPELADELGALVVEGTKTATCSALWDWEAEEEPIPEVGDKAVILDGLGRPLCVVETTGVEIRAFEEVDDRLAYDEGEGDRSLEYWRGAHRRFFRGRYRRSAKSLRRRCRWFANGFVLSIRWSVRRAWSGRSR